MKSLRIFFSLIALSLTFIALSFLFGQFVPSIKSEEMTLSQHIIYAVIGVITLGVAVFLWNWSAKSSGTSK
jgi:drug/metabolite transporter (DMT)-like permease